MNFNQASSEKGFTLIEMMIAIAILAFISLGVFHAMTSSFKIRDKILTEGDFLTRIRLSIGMISKDIQLIYNPILMLPPEPKKTENNNGTDPQLSGQNYRQESVDGGNYWGPILDKTGIRAAVFTGNETQMSFITSSHERIYRESPESRLAKITYELREDTFAKGNLEGTQVFTKIEDINVFLTEDNVDDHKKVYPILYGVVQLKLDYYFKAKERWEKRWDSQSEDFQYSYPDTVRMTVEVKSEGNETYEGVYLFKLEVPNNGLDTSF
ncbi:MAG: hypothetical protein CL678_05035 [Bdellovibrionaceae bacterium]|nr:hypothetical protein [Pseudobdellovibrionaceae bacterium]|tara:strand:- start:1586 stop:2389 length:804 start_codon:yes stop_codon:yes gene_type:complete